MSSFDTEAQTEKDFLTGKEKRVITYGTFDLFHRGHLNIIRRAKELGDYLLVAVSSDAFNAIKGKESYHSEDDRCAILESIIYVDEVILEDSWDQKVQNVIDYDIDVFVMGEDWQGKFDFLQEYCEVVYLPRTEGVSSTQIKCEHPDVRKTCSGKSD